MLTVIFRFKKLKSYYLIKKKLKIIRKITYSFKHRYHLECDFKRDFYIELFIFDKNFLSKHVEKKNLVTQRYSEIYIKCYL